MNVYWAPWYLDEDFTLSAFPRSIAAERVRLDRALRVVRWAFIEALTRLLGVGAPRA